MATERTDNPRSHSDYTIGWVCALAKEQTAATAMLDIEYEDDLPIPEDDYNIYTRGSIGKHNVVIACLPEGIIGTTAAATVVKEMLRTFPSIRFGLMVGIGGGIPNIQDHDVRLGDVVVSVPQETFPGVVQWDLGKAEQEGFKRIGSLNHPPNLLLSAVSKLRTRHAMRGPRIPAYLDQLARNWPLLASEYLRSDALRDILFESEYPHDKNKLNNDCQLCDATRIVSREPRAAKMKIHYGLIASGNQVIKDAMVRDKLNDKLGGNVLCIEMEAAGLMNNFPCLVIRGICDYADAHKNKRWQEHAAAIAAAYAKEFLQEVAPTAVNRERAALEVIQEVKQNVFKTAEDVNYIRSDLKRQEDLAIIEWLTPMNHGSQHSLYRDRRQPETGSKVLFCQGIPGAGKSVLSALVIEDLSSAFGQTASIGIAYIYCDYQRHDQQTPLQLISSLTKQLCLLNTTLPPYVKDLYNLHQPRSTTPSLKEICEVFQNIVRSYTQVYVLIDALDELSAKAGYRNTFLDELLKVKDSSPTLNMLFTSRPLAVPEVRHFFSHAMKMEISAPREDINKFIDGYLAQLSPDALIPNNDDLREEVKGAVAQAVSGMFLLARLYLDSLVDKLSPNQVRCALEVMKNQNRGVDKKSMEDTLCNAYDHTMARITGQKKDIAEHAMYVLLWLTYTQRPLKVDELRHALAVKVGAKDLNRGDLIPHLNLSMYAGLAVIDDKTQEVRLVHYTTQEYLEQRHFKPALYTNPHVTITDICVTYLMLSVFKSGPCSLKDEYIERISAYSLYLYAARYWAHHARLCSEPSELLLKFLGCNEATRGAAQADHVGTSFYFTKANSAKLRSEGSYFCKLRSELHLAARYDLHQAVEALLEKGHDLNALETRKTPLYVALEHGNITTAQILLRKGEQVIRSGGIPVLHAFCADIYGHTEVDVSMVDDLLNRGARIAYDCGNCPLLVWGAGYDQEQLVDLLLQRGAKVESLNDYRFTPLFAAASVGHTTAAPAATNSPAMPGLAANCDGFYKVASGDSCDTIASKNSITTTQFKSWNTEIDARTYLPHNLNPYGAHY
ncbi:purine and uridine phosphorylase [Neurospora tetraspora]|uniref:Purine and uridine phosphorylase n=1 Tax=Neurospora tetraspora TaxID=94610 RepID=A0AAE0MNR3_9PEZI|nr:purine and uridine phosphorylase [Neurospora tetraspora]